MKKDIRCTYRLQLHKDFTFNHALEIVPYLKELGVSHVYSSPFFRATPGSMHGYDICDHNELNPEIGTREEFEAWVAELHQHELKLIVDFVPNHMGIDDPGNYRWRDVLENGPASPYARYFDIEWHPIKQALQNKVLLPVLGEQYGRVLANGHLQIDFEEEQGIFFLRCQDTLLPVTTSSIIPLLRHVTELLAEVSNELLSIISAIQHLPASTEVLPDAIEEGLREKNIIRSRFKNLWDNNLEVRNALQSTLAKWNDNLHEENLERLDQLVSEQSYRPSYWRVAAEEINYRRFFDVNSLAAIRMDLPGVFDETHRLLFELFREGLIDGVRIDHIDGLALPAQYLHQLRQQMNGSSGGSTDSGLIYVEKILGADESLPDTWPIDGTTGYEFGNQVMNVLIDLSHESALTRVYERFVDERQSYKKIAYQSKLLIMQLSMASEINMLGTLLSRLAESHRDSRDFTLNALTTAIREVVAAFPVYRTYLEKNQIPDDRDMKVIQQAVALARRRNPALERSVFEFLKTVLIFDPQQSSKFDEDKRWAFVRKFQQCTGPITAKGIEDTTFYRFHRLIALNEVGGEPDHFGSSVDAFHEHCIRRGNEWPNSLLATSTHDTKRSEDVRARLLALGEQAPGWSKAVNSWRRLNARHKILVEGVAAPDSQEEYYLYQTLVGTWPLEEMSSEQLEDYIIRIKQHMVKALHESKINSSWIDPNVAWDQAVELFVERILTPQKSQRFRASLVDFVSKVAPLGAINSLAQTVLKFTIPGVPDIYQGTECWDFSMVDPDNRRPVDFQIRDSRLSQFSPVADLLNHWRDGNIKLFIIKKLLELRSKHPELFAGGEYIPVKASGSMERHVIAFLRSHENKKLLLIVPRLTSALGFPAIGDCWQDTQLRMTMDQASKWTNAFTGETRQHEDVCNLKDLLSDLPVAVLISVN